MKRSENRRRSRQVALGLQDRRLERQGMDVIRGNIENLIKFSQRFGKTTKAAIGTSVVIEQADVARVEALGLVEIRLALVPSASPALETGQRFRDSAAIGK